MRKDWQTQQLLGLPDALGITEREEGESWRGTEKWEQTDT